MSKQFGGLKLKNPSKTGFKAVYDMINSRSSALNLLTYKSLKGFMFILNVSVDDSEYLTLNGTQFTKPVTSFILKFAVITPHNDEPLDIYKGRDKASESKDSYFEEAQLQQQIWKSSIIGGRPEVCPPVANFSLFDNKNSRDLISFLQSKTRGDTKDVFDYLLTQINKLPTNEIGVIVMPNVEKSATFGDFIDQPAGTNFYGISLNTEYKNMAYAYVTAQIARLFIAIGVIHFDLHSGNALIYLTSDNRIKSLIIDFGRASNIMTDTDDDYLDVSEKQGMREKKEEFFNRLFDLNEDAPDKDKVKFILSILDYIADLDLIKNQALFNFSDPQRYQMDWYRNYPRRSHVPLLAFDILKETTTSEGVKLLPTTIKQYERQGFLVNFSRGITEFIVPFPGTSTSATSSNSSISSSQDCDEVDESTGMCTIMGGINHKKSKKHKTKKQRKSKKHKKTRKHKRSKNYVR